MDITWEDGFSIKVRIDSGTVIISANKEGLLSLVGIITELAEGEPGGHIHLDEHNSLEVGSVEMIIERI